MAAPDPIRLTRRGELLRAISHAIRCLNQVSPGDCAMHRKEAAGFKKRIWSSYSDVLNYFPVEFEPWLDNRAAGIYDAQQQEQINKLLVKLGNETQGEKLA